MTGPRPQSPDTASLRQQLKEAKQKLYDATTPAQRLGAQRRVGAVVRAMQAAGMDTNEVRVITPRTQAPPTRPAPTTPQAAPRRAPTFQEQMEERRRTEKELGIERGRAKKDTLPPRLQRRGG